MLDPSPPMCAMLEEVHRAGGHVISTSPKLLPARTLRALARRGLLAFYRTDEGHRVALTVAGAAALRHWRRLRRAVGAEIQRELVAELKKPTKRSR